MHARPPSLLLFVQRCYRLPHPCLGLAAACFSLSPAPELGFAGSRETLGLIAHPDATPLAKEEPGGADWYLLVHTVLPTPCTDLAQFMQIGEYVNTSTSD